MHRGSCLCGTVQYEADRVQGPYVYCHCESCRKSSGTAFAANVSVAVNEFRVVSGAEQLTTYESSPGKVRHFCGQCGSPLYTKVGRDPKFVRVRLGSLDTDFSQHPSAHIFVAQKAHWHTIDGHRTQYAEWPDVEDVKIPGSRQSASDR